MGSEMCIRDRLIIELTKKASTISPKILDEILTNRDSREKYKYLFDLYEAHDYKYILT